MFEGQQPPPDSDATGPIPVVTQAPLWQPGPPQQAGPPLTGGPARQSDSHLTGSVSSGPPPHKHSRTGAAWVALVVAAVVLVFLLIFVGQNSGAVQVRYLGLEGSLPLGVAMAFAAVAGALTVALLGTVRILQLRSRSRRAAGRR